MAAMTLLRLCRYAMNRPLNLIGFSYNLASNKSDETLLRCALYAQVHQRCYKYEQHESFIERRHPERELYHHSTVPDSC